VKFDDTGIFHSLGTMHQRDGRTDGHRATAKTALVMFGHRKLMSYITLLERPVAGSKQDWQSPGSQLAGCILCGCTMLFNY